MKIPDQTLTPERKTARQLAEEITARLFTNHYLGKKADRMEMKFKQPDGSERGNGGWCEASVIGEIERKLNENLFWNLSL